MLLKIAASLENGEGEGGEAVSVEQELDFPVHCQNETVLIRHTHPLSNLRYHKLKLNELASLFSLLVTLSLGSDREREACLLTYLNGCVLPRRCLLQRRGKGAPERHTRRGASTAAQWETPGGGRASVARGPAVSSCTETTWGPI